MISFSIALHKRNRSHFLSNMMCCIEILMFDVHRAVHRNIISKVKQKDAPMCQIYFILE